MKTYEQLASDCAQQADASWKQWTRNYWVAYLLTVAFLFSSVVLLLVHHWPSALIAVGTGCLLTFQARDAIKKRDYFWNEFMRIRDECLDATH